MGDGVVVVLGLDHRNGVVGTEIQEIICPLWFLPEDHVSPQINLAVGDLGLHGDLAPAPLGGHSGGNVLEFDVLLCHIFFWQNRMHLDDLLYGEKTGWVHSGYFLKKLGGMMFSV